MSDAALSRPLVFSLIQLPTHVAAAVEAAFDLVVAEDGDPLDQLSAETAWGRAFDAVITGIGVRPLDATAIAKLPSSVRIIASYSVGTDHIDLAAAKEHGIGVSNTPGTLVDAVADAAIFLILGAARRATESINLVRSRAWQGWRPDQLLGVELRGRTLGIFGMGEVGLAVAARARAFGMNIAYTNRRPREGSEARFVADPLALTELSDVLLLAAPSTPATRGFVNAGLLARARPSLLIVNVARGDLVVDEDLIAALHEERIAGAALDVFAGEPHIHEGYFDLPNLFMLPHIGSSTVEARAAMGESVIRSIRACLGGNADPSRLV